MGFFSSKTKHFQSAACFPLTPTKFESYYYQMRTIKKQYTFDDNFDRLESSIHLLKRNTRGRFSTAKVKKLNYNPDVISNTKKIDLNALNDTIIPPDYIGEVQILYISQRIHASEKMIISEFIETRPDLICNILDLSGRHTATDVDITYSVDFSGESPYKEFSPFDPTNDPTTGEYQGTLHERVNTNWVDIILTDSKDNEVVEIIPYFTFLLVGGQDRANTFYFKLVQEGTAYRTWDEYSGYTDHPGVPVEITEYDVPSEELLSEYDVVIFKNVDTNQNDIYYSLDEIAFKYDSSETVNTYSPMMQVKDYSEGSVLSTYYNDLEEGEKPSEEMEKERLRYLRQKKMLREFSLEFEDVDKLLQDGEVDDLRIGLGINPIGTSPEELDYLFNFFESQETIDFYTEVSVGDIEYVNGEYVPKIGEDSITLQIEQDDLNIEYTFKVYKQLKAGSIEESKHWKVKLKNKEYGFSKTEYVSCKESDISYYLEKQVTLDKYDITRYREHVKTKSKGYSYEFHEYSYTGVSYSGDGSGNLVPYSREATKPAFKYMKQIDDNSYIEVTVENFTFNHTVNGRTATSYLDVNNESNIYLLTKDGYLKGVKPFKSYVSLFDSSLIAIAYAHTEVKVKWYQSRLFTSLLQLAAIVITIYSAGTASSAAAFILEMATSSAITYIASEIAKEIGGTAGAIIGTVVAVAGTLYANNGTFNLDMNMDLWITLSQQFLQINNVVIEDTLQKEKKEYERYMEDIDEDTKSIQEATEAYNEASYGDIDLGGLSSKPYGNVDIIDMELYENLDLRTMLPNMIFEVAHFMDKATSVN